MSTRKNVFAPLPGATGWDATGHRRASVPRTRQPSHPLSPPSPTLSSPQLILVMRWVREEKRGTPLFSSCLRGINDDRKPHGKPMQLTPIRIPPPPRYNPPRSPSRKKTKLGQRRHHHRRRTTPPPGRRAL